jgi:hypothetical protein
MTLIPSILREIRTYYKKACGNEEPCDNENACGNKVSHAKWMGHLSHGRR